VRLAVIDGGKVKAELKDVGQAGQRSLQRRLAALPPIPEKPPLRPEGSDAALLAIARQITFPSDARPHIDDVRADLEATKSVKAPKL